MFQGLSIVVDKNYKEQTQQEQLLVAKELGEYRLLRVFYRQIGNN